MNGYDCINWDNRRWIEHRAYVDASLAAQQLRAELAAKNEEIERLWQHIRLLSPAPQPTLPPAKP